MVFGNSFFCLLLLIISTFSSLPINNSSLLNTSKYSAPLRFSLTIKNSQLCLGDSVKILGRLENISDKEVIVDKRILWSNLNFRFDQNQEKQEKLDDTNKPFSQLLKLPKFKVIMGDNFESEDIVNDFLPLKPNDHYEETYDLNLSDSFFSLPGQYKMSSSYRLFTETPIENKLFRGDVSSNELKFEILDCTKKNK